MRKTTLMLMILIRMMLKCINLLNNQTLARCNLENYFSYFKKRRLTFKKKEEGNIQEI